MATFQLYEALQPQNYIIIIFAAGLCLQTMVLVTFLRPFAYYENLAKMEKIGSKKELEDLPQTVEEDSKPSEKMISSTTNQVNTCLKVCCFKKFYV